MQRKILYPREDVFEFRTEITKQTKRIDVLVLVLDLKGPSSRASQTINDHKKMKLMQINLSNIRRL